MNKISIENLRFEDMSLKSDSGRQIFANVNFELPLNRIVWVRGQSGAGKSTLMKILAGLTPVSGGRFLFNGVVVNNMSFEEFLPYRLNIGYSFDFGGLINNRTIASNLSLPLEYHHSSDTNTIPARINKYVERFKLEDVVGERPSAIVGGLRKAVCVVRAFVADPELLVLDDPSVGLRPHAVQALIDLINEKRKAGIAKHIFIASEDERFMKNFETTTLIVRDQNLFFADQELAA